MEAPGFLKRLSKLDLADAVGVFLSDELVSVALLKKRLQSVRVEAVESMALSGSVESHGDDVAGFVRRFVDSHRVDGARLALVLERRDTLLGDLELPATAADNILKVVEYELDRIMPVPSDQLYHGLSLRPMGTQGERIGVSVVAALRERVDQRLAILGDVELAPTAVTVLPAALCHYVGFCLGEDAPPVGIFQAEGDRDYITVCSRGFLIASHHIDSVKEGGYREALLREIERSVPERTGEPGVVVVAGLSEPGALGLEDIAPPGFFPEGVVPSQAELVAVGAALGQLGEGGTGINLLPASMIRVEQGMGLREIGLSALVGVLALILVASIGLKNLSISNALAAELARLEPVVTQVSQRQEGNRRLAVKLEVLESAREHGMLRYLRALTVLVPKTAYLTTFRFRGSRLEVDGIADNAAELISILEKSPQFKNVEFTAPTTKYLQDKERFSLRMGFEK